MFKMAPVLITLILSSVSHAGVLTDLDAVETKKATCMSSATANYELKKCVWTAHTAADIILNQSYQVIVAELKTKTGHVDLDKDNTLILKRLVTAERTWIPFRDAECNLQGIAMLGGSGEDLIIGSCLFSQTVARIRSLEELFHSPR